MTRLDTIRRRTIATLVGLLFVLAGFATQASPAAATEAKPKPFFGVISQRLMESEDFDHMASGQLGSFRMPIDWSGIERRGDGNMDWEYIDLLVETTAERGISFLPTLYNSPSWLSDNHKRFPLWNSYAISKWKNFLASAVARYGTDGSFWVQHPDVPYKPIMKWQIWNEVNIRYFALPVSPRAYSKLLRISSTEIRRIDPDAKIVTAGFYATPPEGKGIDATEFLDRLYRFPGFRSSFDIAAIHPYASTTRKSMKLVFPIRRVMNKHHDRRKRMLITEIGWGSDSATVFGKGDLAGQAGQVRSAYRALLAHRAQLKLDGVYWFSWADLAPDLKGCAFCLKTGLFDSDGQPKPSWYEMLNFSRR